MINLKRLTLKEIAILSVLFITLISCKENNKSITQPKDTTEMVMGLMSTMLCDYGESVGLDQDLFHSAMEAAHHGIQEMGRLEGEA